VSAAVHFGRTDIVELMLQNSAQCTDMIACEVAPQRSGTLLMKAATHGQLAVARVLLQHGADVQAVNQLGLTALHRAALANKPETIPLLLEHGADVNTSAVDGITPMGYAARNASALTVQLLVAAGADLIAVAAEGTTALHQAALNTQADVLQLLLEQAGTAHIDDLAPLCHCCGSCTALMMCKQPTHVKLLLAAGADVHTTTAIGNTCLHIAAAHSHPASVVCLLIKAGADLSAVNVYGKTAAQVAHDKGNTLVESLLIRAATSP
jgi:ankyrin repeat protein